MRAHNDEHSDNLPVIDIAALRHVVYVFDALIYYMRSGTDTDTDVFRDGISVISWQDHDENENEEHDDDPVNNSLSMETESVDGESDIAGKSGRKHPFFQRSDSTIFFGCPPPDPFQTALVEALPLADQPHLLQPNSRREDLFGIAKQAVVTQREDESKCHTGSNPFEKPPIRLSLSSRMIDTTIPPLYMEPVPVSESIQGMASSVVDTPFTSTGVIVKPNSHVTIPTTATTTTPTPAMTATPGPSQSEPVEFTDRPPSDTVIVSVPADQPEKMEVQQASVIVHVSSAQAAAAAVTENPSAMQSPGKNVPIGSTTPSVTSPSSVTPANVSSIPLPSGGTPRDNVITAQGQTTPEISTTDSNQSTSSAEVAQPPVPITTQPANNPSRYYVFFYLLVFFPI